MSDYMSSIPQAAHKHVIERSATGQVQRSEYVLDEQVVGIRGFNEAGELEWEFPLKDGRYDGIAYRWASAGVLLSAEPYKDGLPHGIAKQWAIDGRLMGTYTMHHGTGIDLWWGGSGSDTYRLSEARYLVQGQRHGYEWWIDTNQHEVSEERHCWHGQLHGIERVWNEDGRLRRGYPRYYLHGEQVTKRHYMQACRTAPELPLFQAVDNLPARTFPPEIVVHLYEEPS